MHGNNAFYNEIVAISVVSFYERVDLNLFVLAMEKLGLGKLKFFFSKVGWILRNSF